MAHSRDELVEMIDRYQACSDRCGETGDWTALGEFYTDDAIYTWNNGADWGFAARGPQQIVEWVMGTEMAGLEGWNYPYIRKLIDPEQDECVGFWRQIAPVNDPATGKPYEIQGTGGSWFHYAGDFKWDWQRDFFDHMNAGHTFLQMAKNGHLSDEMQRRMGEGSGMPGWHRLEDFDWLTTLPGS